MATLTKEQIEQKQLRDDDLAQATGGKKVLIGETISQEQYDRSMKIQQALEEGRWDDWEKMHKGLI